MSNFNYADYSTKLINSMSLYGVTVSQEQAQLLLKHLDLVIEKNKVMNLTRITNPDDAVVLHVVDSLLPLASKHYDTSLRSYLDIGTGAGFPGIPLAVMTHAHGVLIDSVGKKVSAVREFITELGLGNRVEACAIRAEELAKTRMGSFDLVIARAVAQTNTLIEYAAPFLVTGGLLMVCKANPTDEELSHADSAASICGLENVSRETFELPNGLGHREILTYKKLRKPSIKLPRRVGMAQHEPLG